MLNILDLQTFYVLVLKDYGTGFIHLNTLVQFFFNKKLVTFWLTANKKTCFLYSNFSIRFYKFI